MVAARARSASTNWTKKTLLCPNLVCSSLPGDLLFACYIETVLCLSLYDFVSLCTYLLAVPHVLLLCAPARIHSYDANAHIRAD